MAGLTQASLGSQAALGQSLLSQSASAMAMANQRNFANALSPQLAAMQHGASFSRQGLALQYLAASRASAHQQAYNPLLLQLLAQNMMNPTANTSATQQIRATAALGSANGARATGARPDPPTAGLVTSNASPPLSTDIGSILASLQANSAAAALRMNQLSATPTSGPQLGLVASAAPAPAGSATVRDSANHHRAPNRDPDDRGKLLYVSSDEESVNSYQRFARKQIELFEAQQEDVDAGAQGKPFSILSESDEMSAFC